MTPDLQPEGDVSLSLQWQNKRIANPYEFQVELGLTKWREVAMFQGLKPSEQIFGGEVALIKRELRELVHHGRATPSCFWRRAITESITN